MMTAEELEKHKAHIQYRLGFGTRVCCNSCIFVKRPNPYYHVSETNPFLCEKDEKNVFPVSSNGYCRFFVWSVPRKVEE